MKMKKLYLLFVSFVVHNRLPMRPDYLGTYPLGHRFLYLLLLLYMSLGIATTVAAAAPAGQVPSIPVTTATTLSTAPHNKVTTIPTRHSGDNRIQKTAWIPAFDGMTS